MNGSSQILPRRLVTQAVLGMLVTALLVSLVTAIPLYRSAMHEAEQALGQQLRSRAKTIEEHLETFANTARQVASRTHARRQLAAYNRGEIDQAALEREVAPILEDALRHSDELAGIIRLDRQGQAVVIVGMPLPTDQWPRIDPAARDPRFCTPFTRNGQSFVSVSMPILDRKGTFEGTDLMIFRLGRLWQLLEDWEGMPASAHLLLGRLDGEGELVPFGMTAAGGAVLRVEEGLRAALKRAIQGEHGLVGGERVDGRPVIIAHQPIAYGDWGLAMMVDEDEVYAPAYRQIRYTGMAVAAMILFGMLATVWLTRPLVGRIMVDTDELARQVEEKASELALSRENLAEAQALAHIGSFEWDLPSGRVEWSDELYRITGLPVDATRVHRDSLLGLVRAEERQQVARATERVLSRPTRISLDFAILTPDGQERALHQVLESRADPEGHIVSVLGTVQDVTERYRVERVMRSLAQAASGSGGNDFFVTCLRNLTEIYDVRDAFIGLLDEEEQTVTTLYLWSQGRLVDNLTYQVADTPCQDIMLGNRGLITDRVAEQYPKDHMLVEMNIESYYGAPLVAADGRVFGLVSVMDDRPLSVTPLTDPILGVFASRIAVELERRRGEERLARFNEELEQRIEERTRELRLANRELEAYSYSIAHDLRAPLRSVTSFSQVVLEDAAERLTDEDKDHLRRVVHAGKHMARLIDEILELSRITRTELRPTRVDLSALSRSLLRKLAEQEPERRVEWVVQEGLEARGDATLLGVVMQNLLGNAWKFTAREPRARIEVGMRREGEERVFWVRDNGVGFDMGHAGKLFQTFHRLHRQDEFAGTGVGLATVRRIVERHHGRVWAEAQPGEGAVFFFALPD